MKTKMKSPRGSDMHDLPDNPRPSRQTGPAETGISTTHPPASKARNDLAGGVLRITGRVRRPFVLSMEELSGMDTEETRDIPVYCGEGTPGGRIESCRGVLLENVIGKAEVLKEEHNDTKKMFIVALATDGYKVVFSWQEIFNTPVGGGVMVLIERDGRSLCAEPGGIELISVQDYFTGARYVKGLEAIEVLLAG